MCKYVNQGHGQFLVGGEGPKEEKGHRDANKDIVLNGECLRCPAPPNS